MAESNLFTSLINRITGQPAQSTPAPLAAPLAKTASAVVTPAPIPTVEQLQAPLQSAEPRPIIAISGGSADSKSVAAAVAMVQAQGAEPLVITAHEGRSATQDLSKVNGLLVLGNDFDVDPASYGQQAHPETQNENDPNLIAKLEAKRGRPLSESKRKTIANLPHRAAWENEAIQIALAQKIPLTTVCAGTQRLNTILGGTLHQHIPDIVGNTSHAQTEAPYVPVQSVTIDGNSWLGDVANEIRHVIAPQPGGQIDDSVTLMENSFHHQAVDKLGNGLKVSANYADGIIAAIEPDPQGPYANQLVMGVQWHPEFGASPLGPRIFNELAEEAKLHAQSKAAVQQQEARPQWLDNILQTRGPHAQANPALQQSQNRSASISF
jgi:putative glutamine amidotransferase